MKKILSLIIGFALCSMAFAGGLITPEKLNEIKDSNDVVVVDYRSKETGNTVPGALAITNADLGRTVDGTVGMLLSKTEFEDLMSKLGVENTDTMVLVDNADMMWATRLWWALEVYGHEGEIFVLDGQIAAWEKAGYPLEAPRTPNHTTKYVAKEANEDLIADMECVRESVESEDVVMIDARSTLERMKGHIPNSTFIEYKNNLNADGTYKSKEELRKIYEAAGITEDKEIYAHCQTAVRSTQTMFALVELLGYKNVRNYDGSWAEYSTSGEPIKRGL